MVRYSHRSVFNTRLYITLITVAIAILLACQHFWFSNSASSAVESSYRTISEAVQQTVFREYGRYGIILDKVSAAQRDGFASETFLRGFLSELAAKFGPASIDARLLLGAGYGIPARRESPSCVLFLGKGWGLQKTVVTKPAPAEIEKRLAAGQAIMYTSAGESSEDVLLFDVRCGSGTTYRIGLWLDTDRFFSTYVERAVASALAEYVITWESRPTPMPEDSESGGLRPPPGDPGYWSPYGRIKYRFNPIRGLFGGSKSHESSADQGLRVFVPRIPLSGAEWDGDLVPAPIWNAPHHYERYNTLLGRAREPRESLEDNFRVAVVRLPDSSIERAIEQRNSFYWLGATLLLIGIEFSFSFLVVQQGRLRRLHNRERELLASVTHELRTPLTVIRSAAENIRTGIVPAERLRQYADLIMEQTGRLGRLVDDALVFARVEANLPRPPESVDVDAQRLVRTLRESLEPLAAHSGLEILWDGKDLPSCFRGNGKGITLILQNVITNAVYHAYPCGASGPIRVYGGTLRKGGLYFRVEDEGQGIPSKEAKRVFEPFYRGQASLKNHEKGSGLGLYLVKKTAMVIDASVRLESPYHTEDGSLMNGCRFTLELPHASEVKHES